MICTIIGAGGIAQRLTPLAKVSDFTSYTVIDHDMFEEKNLTRQGSLKTLGKYKTEVMVQTIQILDPHERIAISCPRKVAIRDMHETAPHVVFVTVDNSEARCLVHRASRSPEPGKRPPDLVIYGMNEWQNGEAVLDIPVIPWWPDPARLYPFSFYEGMDDENRPHCHDIQNEGGERAEQIATINAAIAGDMLWLFEAARHMQRHPKWITDPSLEIPLPYAVVTTGLGKRTLTVAAGGGENGL